MARIISKGDIFWGRANDPNNEHMLHPIVIMETVDFREPLPNSLKAVVLSTKDVKRSVAQNVEMSRCHFEWTSPEKRPYKIKVNRKRKEYLVCYGFLKCPSSLHVHEKGRLTPLGIEFVENALKEYGVNNFDYIPYTIKEYNNLTKAKKSNNNK
jgi:hypothetical protein